MVELKDLKPMPTVLRLETVNKSYQLRAFTVRDEIWLRQAYGDKINEVFSEENMDFEAICRIIFRLIVDKSDFVKQTVEIIDEDGNSSTESLGGYHLLSEMILGINEKLAVLESLNHVMGVSRPVLEEIAKKKGEVAALPIGEK